MKINLQNWREWVADVKALKRAIWDMVRLFQRLNVVGLAVVVLGKMTCLRKNGINWKPVFKMVGFGPTGWATVPALKCALHGHI